MFQQLQLREKIRYKLGPRYTHFSSLVRKVKNVWVHFDPRVALSNVQKQKVLEESLCYYKVILPLAISCMWVKFVHNMMETYRGKPQGFGKGTVTKSKNPHNIYLRILDKPVSRCGT